MVGSGIIDAICPQGDERVELVHHQDDQYQSDSATENYDA